MKLSSVPYVLLAFVLMGSASGQERPYIVQPGDILYVAVWKEPDLQGEVLVQPDGKMSFPLIGEMDARGKAVTELQKMISERLAKYISDPVVTVAIREIKGNKIFIIGQVNKPGEFIMNPNVDVMQALSMAGGTTPFASLNGILVLRRNGATQESIRFDYTDVAKGRNLAQNIRLVSGDIVVVP